ncbi:hypothetical protein BEH_07500 [Priestia filamentosa]|uniref:Uncharacterized protein n=1 Tax=Priestia filamentosa TaxID=1402861 RepID=A0A0H4KCW6_9BACI|nr:hypothetical protein [Priestia filamentosa]AKO91957.1 hypothetical protein BEH_07500 [Priestia filamentosa]
MQTVELSLNDVSKQQLEEMKHALGMSYKSKPYRNYFHVNEPDDDWEDLVNKGFAKRGTGINKGTSTVYWLTYAATKLVYGKRISEKYYNEL